jgi:hypothetical protein
MVVEVWDWSQGHVCTLQEKYEPHEKRTHNSTKSGDERGEASGKEANGKEKVKTDDSGGATHGESRRHKVKKHQT